MRNHGLSTVLMMGYMLVSSVGGYKSPQKYHPYKYDLGNVMFTPDGRLLQVEYATTAATAYSTPICLVRLADDLILLVCPVKKTTARRGTTGVSVMDRLIALPIAATNDHYRRSTAPKPGNNNDVVDDDQHGETGTNPEVVVAISGVLADGLALLQKLQGDLLQDVLYFGGKHQPTPLYVADKLASFCQHNCFNGGVRPYGAMVWTIGFTSRGGNGPGRHLEIFQTSPSGGIVQLHLPEDNTIPLILGEGGKDGQELVRELKKTLLSIGNPRSTGSSNNNNNNVSSTIGRVAKLLSSEETEPEVLLLSSSRGALKLTKEQIQSYVKQSGRSIN
jgi:Proteasome subunit A N-terminal signature/Proteasome subunit